MGVGFARDGNNLLKFNKAQRGSSKKRFKEGQKTFLKKGRALIFKNVTKEELEKFKIEFKAQKRKENIMTTIIVTLFLSLLAGLIFYFIK